MLSSAQPPPPREEVAWHAAHQTADGMSYIATTRVLTGLVSNKSVVAFYGDVSLFNDKLLGLHRAFSRNISGSKLPRDVN